MNHTVWQEYLCIWQWYRWSNNALLLRSVHAEKWTRDEHKWTISSPILFARPDLTNFGLHLAFTITTEVVFGEKLQRNVSAVPMESLLHSKFTVGNLTSIIFFSPNIVSWKYLKHATFCCIKWQVKSKKRSVSAVPLESLLHSKFTLGDLTSIHFFSLNTLYIPKNLVWLFLCVCFRIVLVNLY